MSEMEYMSETMDSSSCQRTPLGHSTVGSVSGQASRPCPLPARKWAEDLLGEGTSSMVQEEAAVATEMPPCYVQARSWPFEQEL